MTFQFGQDQELDELRTSHNITKILTNPSGKRGVVSTSKKNCGYDKPVITHKGGSAGFFNQLSSPSQHSCRASLNSRGARLGNILNTYSRLFSISHSPAFDTSLDSNSRRLN